MATTFFNMVTERLGTRYRNVIGRIATSVHDTPAILVGDFADTSPGRDVPGEIDFLVPSDDVRYRFHWQIRKLFYHGKNGEVRFQGRQWLQLRPRIYTMSDVGLPEDLFQPLYDSAALCLPTGSSLKAAPFPLQLLFRIFRDEDLDTLKTWELMSAGVSIPADLDLPPRIIGRCSSAYAHFLMQIADSLEDIGKQADDV